MDKTVKSFMQRAQNLPMRIVPRTSARHWRRALVLGALVWPVLCSADLTGTWSSDDGGTYYLRQIGEQLFWYGEAAETNPGWANVLVGTVQGQDVSGNWVDVPKGRAGSKGEIQLRIAPGQGKLGATRKTGGFGGTHWTRVEPITSIKKLENRSSKYCLDTDGKAVNGGAVRMWNCGTHPNQTWTVDQVDASSYRLINESSKYCLDTDGSKQNGGQVRMWGCANHPNQLWEISSLPQGGYRLTNKASGFCLDTDGQAANGGAVRMWSCATHPNQTWSSRK
jgi:hypothetical protein